MAYVNGRLPEDALFPIAGGGQLQRGPAEAWNDMNAEAETRWGKGIIATDSYRPLGHPGDLARGLWDQWAAWERYEQGGNLAAHPGTSNHGLGLAVDVDRWTRWVIDQIGEQFGWSKAWSDAQSEWWHILWRRGIWPPQFQNLSRGARGEAVVFVQARLWIKGFKTVKVDGDFGPATAKALATFKSKRHLPGGGNFLGHQAWRELKAA